MPGTNTDTDREDKGDRTPRPATASVRPLERGLAVLRAVSAPDCGGLRPGDLVRATGLARSTVDRVVATLARLGLLRQEGQGLVPAPRLMELGNAYLSASGLPDALRPYAKRLADELDESVSLAVPDRDGVRFVVQVTRRRTMSLAFRIGDVLPAERCAPGVLFAESWGTGQWARWRERQAADPHDRSFTAVPPRHSPADETDFRQRTEEAAVHGWSLDDQLIEPGLIAVAVPVRGPHGEAVCALSVVSHTSRHTASGLAGTVLEKLQATAGEMEDALTRATTAAGVSGPGQEPAAVSAEVTAEVTAAKEELGPHFLQALARGLAVLQALGRARGDGLPLTALAGLTGLPRATARRSLLALEALGYAESSGHLFRPLPRVLELGYAHLSGLSFTDIVQPHLEQLSARTCESASVTVLDGDDIRYVARVAANRVMTAGIGLGTRFPAWATAMGRVLLAGLPAEEAQSSLERTCPEAFTSCTVTSPPALAALVAQAGRDGYAAVTDELEEGLASVAVPVHAADGTVVAALNVAGHSGPGGIRLSRTELLTLLRRTAGGIEEDLRTVFRHRPLQTS